MVIIGFVVGICYMLGILDDVIEKYLPQAKIKINEILEHTPIEFRFD